ncbi:MAG TPA: ElyC/SanA/YdcF family protein [Patescibacteria group bacterium]|nr:ElyC/SanA/YdcF family protein [Patescibacteria group bacterium]
MSIAQEFKNNTQTTKFDTLIVFGEGPIKKVFLPNELTTDQIERSKQFKKTPMKFKEPNFYVLENEEILARIEKLSPAGKKRLYWKLQHNSRLALKRWGRQNALAAGLALYSGITKMLLLSGGKTKSKLLELSEKEMERWPTEAELMQDAIVRNFGKIYKEKFGKDIKQAIILEEKATNTLENFAYSINTMPEIVSESFRVGLLTAHHHVKRVTLLGKLFSLGISEDGVLSAQDLLRKGKLYSQYEKDVLQIIDNINQCEDLKDLNYFEERWIQGLKDPKYLSYWFGYVAEVKHPRVLDRAFVTLRQPSWEKAALEVFSLLKLAMGDYTKQSLAELSKSNPDKYQELVRNLRQLKTPKFRKMPPPLTATI